MEPFRTEGRYLLIKRIMDVLCSGTALVILAPVFLITGLAILLEDGRPVLFVQDRVGKDERVFQMYKFRSMYKNAAEQQKMLQKKYQSENEVIFKLRNDPRITKVGFWIRKTSIDELPQLVNILKGDMSIVGPRPLPVYEHEAMKGKYGKRYRVDQGLTCYWQISGRSNVGYEKRMQMDMQYVDDANIWLDIRLIFKTLRTVLSGEGAY